MKKDQRRRLFAIVKTPQQPDPFSGLRQKTPPRLKSTSTSESKLNLNINLKSTAELGPASNLSDVKRRVMEIARQGPPAGAKTMFGETVKKEA